MSKEQERGLERHSKRAGGLGNQANLDENEALVAQVHEGVLLRATVLFRMRPKLSLCYRI